MGTTFKNGRTCKKCGLKISDKNKSGYCNKHRDRNGANNSFYGKKHSKESIENMKKKLSKTSKRLWEDKIYRNKVIKGVSKPRRNGFKKEQSKRITQWYKDNPEQFKIRSNAMRRTWEKGNIEPNVDTITYNKSKTEKLLFEDIKTFCKDVVCDYKIHIKDSRGHKWYFPDIIIIGRKIIIELYGDYWHANAKRYSENSVVYHGILAKDIWNRDKTRTKELESFGYKVIVVWESEYKKEKHKVMEKIKYEIGCKII